MRYIAGPLERYLVYQESGIQGDTFKHGVVALLHEEGGRAEGGIRVREDVMRLHLSEFSDLGGC